MRWSLREILIALGTVVLIVVVAVIVIRRDARDGILDLDLDFGGKVVTACGRPGDQAPSWAPDGEQVAFVRCGADELLVVRAVKTSGGPSRELFTWGPSEAGHQTSITELSWSEDGRLAFVAASRPRDGAAGSSALYVWSPGANEPEQLVGGADGAVSSPAWSPDGRLIAYVFGMERLVVRDTRTGRVVRNFPGVYGVSGRPSWSPDSSRIAVNLTLDGVRLVDVRGSGPPAVVTESPGCAPVWVDRDNLARVLEGDPSRLVLLTTAGRPVAKHRLPSGHDYCHGVSPDARAVLYTDDRGNPDFASEVWVVEVATGAKRRLTDASS